MQASFLIACYLEPIGAFFRAVLNGTRLEKLSPAVIVRKTNFLPVKNGNSSDSARCCGMMQDGGISRGPLCFILLRNRRAKIGLKTTQNAFQTPLAMCWSQNW